MSEIHSEVDSSGLKCPLPVIKARQALNKLTVGQRLRLIATDRGAIKDIPAFCKMMQHNITETIETGEKLIFIIEKGTAA